MSADKLFVSIVSARGRTRSLCREQPCRHEKATAGGLEARRRPAVQFAGSAFYFRSG